MTLRRFSIHALIGLLQVAGLSFSQGCGNDEPPAIIINFGSGGETTTGGAPETGGSLETGGTLQADAGTNTGGTAGTGGSTGTGGAFETDASVGTGAVAETGGNINPDASIEPDGAIESPRCGGETIAPAPVEVEVEVEVLTRPPLALFIMLDVTGSMIPHWTSTLRSLQSFLNAPDSAGIDVGMEFFPTIDPADHCVASAYAQPTVDFGRLPAHAATLSSHLNAEFPTSVGTPLEAVLGGGTMQCQSFMSLHPDEACVILLITDGLPGEGSNDCSTNVAAIVEAPKVAGIRVFTWTFPGAANVDLLNAIADETGTDCDPSGTNSACNLTDSAHFSDAFASFREAVSPATTQTETRIKTLDCEWELPVPPPGSTPNPSQLNVLFSGPDGEYTFAKVANEGNCGNAADAWYYDDGADPARIIACPQTCSFIKANPTSMLEIEQGCPTRMKN